MRLGLGLGIGSQGGPLSAIIENMFAWYRGGIEDISGHGNDLSLFNGAAFTGSGVVDTPLVLDGVNDYATFPEAVFAGECSITLWANGNLAGDYLFGQIDGNGQYVSWNSDTDLRLQLAGNQIWTNVVPALAGWTHIAITRGPGLGTCKLYINGTIVSGTKDMSGDFTLSAIGRILGGGYYAGSMDDIRLFTEELTASQVFDVYSSTPSPITDVDLFLLAGQSNCEGQGDSATSTKPPVGMTFTGSALEHCLDPVGSADTGSMWPSFAREWFIKTGRMAIMIPSYQDGSGLTPEADTGFGDYSPSGSLRAQSVTDFNTAKSWIQANTSYTIQSENILWCQGENDAYQIALATITEADYKDALEALATYWDTNIGQDMMYVIRTGRKVSGAQEAGYQSIRDAQDDACTDSSLLTMTFTGAVDFAAAGKMVDDVHWDQIGLNEAGKGCASLVATDKGF